MQPLRLFLEGGSPRGHFCSVTQLLEGVHSTIFGGGMTAHATHSSSSDDTTLDDFVSQVCPAKTPLHFKLWRKGGDTTHKRAMKTWQYFLLDIFFSGLCLLRIPLLRRTWMTPCRAVSKHALHEIRLSLYAILLWGQLKLNLFRASMNKVLQ